MHPTTSVKLLTTQLMKEPLACLLKNSLQWRSYTRLRLMKRKRRYTRYEHWFLTVQQISNITLESWWWQEGWWGYSPCFTPQLLSPVSKPRWEWHRHWCWKWWWHWNCQIPSCHCLHHTYHPLRSVPIVWHAWWLHAGWCHASNQ